VRYLITGGCGFLGSNIASRLLKSDHVIVFDNLSRIGASENLTWLQKQDGNLQFIHGDIRCQSDCDDLISKIKPDVIFHLAGQVAMTTSIERPKFDFEINVLGTLNLLEAVRVNYPESSVVFSSTNKVYGDLENLQYTEDEYRYTPTEFSEGLPASLPLDFHSPYGCSKGAADQYILDYSRIFGLKTVVFRHSSMYGGRQFFTSDQGWIGWFCSQAILASKGSINEFTVSGNGKQVRDVLHADDMVELYVKAALNIDSLNGKAFNIGGGVDNSFSVNELLFELQRIEGCKLKWKYIDWRESDQKYFVADITEVGKLIDWTPKVTKEEGILRMLDWVRKIHDR